VIKLNEYFGRSIAMRVDANQGYSLEQLLTFIKETAKVSVELIEQPIAVEFDSDLVKLYGMDRPVLVADESLTNMNSAIELCMSDRKYEAFNIKLMKCGGVKAAKEIAEFANSFGIKIFWGCNDESVSSISAALHAAYSCSNTQYLDLDGSFELANDPVSGGFLLKNGLMYCLELPGFGISRRTP
jgi:L-Ala-D/L-Glu epimerase